MKKNLLSRFLVLLMAYVMTIAFSATVEAEEAGYLTFKSPGRHIVMENFFGLKCGFCPRAHASVNYLQQKYADELVFLNYYNYMDYEFTEDKLTASQGVSGYPKSIFNTSGEQVDPMFPLYPSGHIDEYGNLNIDNYYSNLDRENYFDITLNYKVSDDGYSVGASIERVDPSFSGKVYIKYLLLADGLEAMQTNYYSGNNALNDFPGMEYFGTGGNPITIIANDVVAAQTENIEYTIDADTQNFTFEKVDFKSIEHYLIPPYRTDKIKLVALLTDENGHTLNAVACPVNIDPDSFQYNFIESISLNFNSVKIDLNGVSDELIIEVSPLDWSDDELVFTESDPDLFRLFYRDTVGYRIASLGTPGEGILTVSSRYNPDVKAEVQVKIKDFSAAPEYSLSMSEKTAYTGTIVNIPLILNIEENILGMEFTANLSQGASFVTDEDGFCDLNLNEEYAPAHTVSTNFIAENTLRGIVFSNQNNKLAEGENTILTIPVKIDEDALSTANDGMVSLTISDIIISDQDSKAVRIEDEVVLTMPVKELMRGDLDGDGEVTVADVTNTVNIILDRLIAEDIIPEAADANNDGKINLIDIVTLVNKILNKTITGYQTESKRLLPAEEKNIAVEFAEVAKFEDGTSQIDVNISGIENFIGAQFDIVLPEGWDYKLKEDNSPNITLCPLTAPNHVLTASLMNDARMRILIYSMQNRNFKNGDCCLAHFYITTTTDDNETEGIARLENIMFANSDLSEYIVDDMEFILAATSGIADYDIYNEEMIEVFNLNGIKQTSDLNNLLPGIYICRQGNKAFKVIK